MHQASCRVEPDTPYPHYQMTSNADAQIQFLQAMHAATASSTASGDLLISGPNYPQQQAHIPPQFETTP